MTLTAAELERIVERACTAAVERAFQRQAGATGAEWGIADVAAAIGVSERTVLRMEQRGELPRRSGRRWRKADVLRWHDSRHTAATRIGATVGQPGRLSFPEFVAMFGWRDPRNAMVYVNPSASALAAKLD